ncbi:MAG: cell division protein FtsZ [Clostridia bacterium]|nr:MAG: cell division protein FtsZ [Clostridia bacterium]
MNGAGRREEREMRYKPEILRETGPDTCRTDPEEAASLAATLRFLQDRGEQVGKMLSGLTPPSPGTLGGMKARGQALARRYLRAQREINPGIQPTDAGDMAEAPWEGEENLGYALEQVLIRRGLSVTALAAKLGVTVEHLNDLITNARPVWSFPVTTAACLARHLGLTARQFYTMAAAARVGAPGEKQARERFLRRLSLALGLGTGEAAGEAAADTGREGAPAAADAGCRPCIKVIGVGGAGGNALDNMILSGLGGVEFVAVNTDVQALVSSVAARLVPIGASVTAGLGAGGQPETGARAAWTSHEELAAALAGADMIFIAAGMGGGTGTGAAPVIAGLAREMEILTVAVVTRPFAFEGARRKKQAEAGIAALEQAADAVLVINNDRLLDLLPRRTTVQEAFRQADQVLYRAVQAITDIILTPGLINVDLADLRSVLARSGPAFIGTGQARGENRAPDAACRALSSPLLEGTAVSAGRVVLNISGGPSTTLDEIYQAAGIVAGTLHPEAEIILGAVVDEALQDYLRVTVIAGGFAHVSSGCIGGQGAELHLPPDNFRYEYAVL